MRSARIPVKLKHFTEEDSRKTSILEREWEKRAPLFFALKRQVQECPPHSLVSGLT